MDRRTFIVALVGVLLAGLRDAACAQQTGKARESAFLPMWLRPILLPPAFTRQRQMR